MEEVFKADFDDSEITKKLEDLEKQVLAIGKSVDTVGNQAAESLNQAADAAGNFTAEMDTAATQTAKQARAVDGARAANQSWLQSIKQTIAGQQVGGKSLGEWAEQARTFASNISSGASAAGKATVATRAFGLALKATGIGLIISLVASLIAYFTRFQSGVDKVSQVLAGLGAVVNVLIDRTLKFYGAFLKFFQGDFSGGFEQIGQSISGIGTELVQAATAAYNLEKRLQALRDVTITQSVEAARARVELDKFRQIVDDGTQSIGARINASKQAAAIEKTLAEQAVDRALEAQQIAQQKFALDKDSLAAREEAAKAEIDFQEAVSNLNKVNFDAEKEQRELRKEAADEQKKQAEERKKALEAESKALEKIIKDLDALRAATQPEGIERDLAETEKKYNALQRTAAEGIEVLRKIEARRNLTPEELAQLKELGDIQVKLEDQRLSALVDVVASYAEKDIEIEENLRKAKEALAAKDYDLAVKNLQDAKALREQELAITEQQFANLITVLEENGVSEKDIAKRREEQAKIIQQARLESELQFQTQLLEIARAGDSEAVSQIENTIRLIQEKLAGLLVPDGEKPKSFLESLGLTPEGIKGLDEAKNQIISALNSIADARVKEAEAATQAAERKVQAAEDALQREQELAAQGLANDSELRKKQLEEAKKQREAALKEEAKARRSQILLDSIGQLSSLATASANIFKALSPIPFAGIPLAIATIGIMFGAFAKAKADALKAASVPKFRKGGKLEGPAHEFGGVPISDREGNIYGEAEGGEWIVNREGSREHDRFLKRLNEGEFAGVDLDRVFKPSASNPLSDAAPRIARIEAQRREMETTLNIAAMATAYEKTAAQIVQAIKEQPEIYPLTNYKVKRRKGRNTYTEIVRQEN